jgi:hypothetical protein
VKPFYVGGTGLFAKGFAQVPTWLKREYHPQVVTPPCMIVPANLKRRTSLLTRIALEAATQAVKESGADSSTIPTVFASANGEIAVTVEILKEMLAEPGGLPSPTRFHNSVHNAASGYFSISAKNHSFSTSIAAGKDTFLAGLIEAIGVLHSTEFEEVLLVVVDEPATAPLLPKESFGALATAFHLSRTPLACSFAKLQVHRSTTFPAYQRSSVPEGLHGHPNVVGLHLLDALHTQKEKWSLECSGWYINGEPLVSNSSGEE